MSSRRWFFARLDDVALGVLVALALVSMLHGCNPQVTPAMRARYAEEVTRCIANERAIVDREGSTLDEDRADLALERARCDAALAEIERGAP